MVAFALSLIIAVALWWVLARPYSTLSVIGKAMILDAGVFLMGWLNVGFIFGIVLGVLAFLGTVVTGYLMPIGGRK